MQTVFHLPSNFSSTIFLKFFQNVNETFINNSLENPWNVSRTWTFFLFICASSFFQIHPWWMTSELTSTSETKLDSNSGNCSLIILWCIFVFENWFPDEIVTLTSKHRFLNVISSNLKVSRNSFIYSAKSIEKSNTEYSRLHKLWARLILRFRSRFKSSCTFSTPFNIIPSFLLFAATIWKLKKISKKENTQWNVKHAMQSYKLGIQFAFRRRRIIFTVL